MDYRDSADEAAFRQGVQAWLATHGPAHWPDGEARPDLETAGELHAQRRRWHEALYEAGYVGMAWPVAFGGRGLDPVYEAIFNDELGRSGYPSVRVNFLGRAIIGYGTEEQKARFLPPMLSGEVQWCQGFSEPGAGSDLASLRTRAVLDGDHWVIDGQKMWTSGAPFSDWCLVLVRTDPDVPKHKGISCLLTSMRAPGITTRPIVLASGEPETGEVFFDDVVVPADQMVGNPGDGWRIAMTTVSYERGASDVGMIASYRSALAGLQQRVVEAGLAERPEVRRAVARCYVRGEALRLNAVEALSRRAAGKDPGPESSVGKLLWSDAEQALRHLELEIVGAGAFIGDEPDVLPQYFRSRPVSVYGGSSQIQKNVLSSQILGMPRG